MTKREWQSRQEFIDVITNEKRDNDPQHTVFETSDVMHRAELLLRHGRSYARIQEVVCNGVEWIQSLSNDANDKRQRNHEAWCEKREQQLEKRIRAIVAELGQGFGVVFSGDPRGNTVKIVLPSGRTNDVGREGYCVPTS